MTPTGMSSTRIVASRSRPSMSGRFRSVTMSENGRDRIAVQGGPRRPRPSRPRARPARGAPSGAPGSGARHRPRGFGASSRCPSMSASTDVRCPSWSSAPSGPGRSTGRGSSGIAVGFAWILRARRRGRSASVRLAADRGELDRHADRARGRHAPIADVDDHVAHPQARRLGRAGGHDRRDDHAVGDLLRGRAIGGGPLGRHAEIGAADPAEFGEVARPRVSLARTGTANPTPS